MKVLLFSSHGAQVYTEEMEKILKKDIVPYNRINEIVHYVENNYETINGKPLKDAIEHIKNNKGRFYKIFEEQSNGEQLYYTYNDEIKYVGYFSIVEVDSTRPWTIAEYDGAEYIQYLDCEFEDKELNYRELKHRITS